MKEINLTTKNEQIKYHFKRAIFLAIVISLIQNRTIVWAILNGDTSNWHILVIMTILLKIGAVSGEYIFGRWFREKITIIVDKCN